MTRARLRTAAWTTALVLAAFAALAGIATLMARMHRAWPDGVTRREEAVPVAKVPLPGDRSASSGVPSLPSRPAALPAGLAAVTDALRQRQLLVPVRGVEAQDLRSTFTEARGERVHEALDIMAPAGTPVQAVEDGTVARLFTSAAGGLTVYQFDPTRLVVYYYAHLERYAPGLSDGTTVRRGQVLGYVGSTGNADPAAPHLHFAISVLGPEKRWWEGTPIDPYDVLR
ncbi:hypothetical protein TBR22_A35630 [Luteitalea sp. TBR-22]|uniref:M23 family metallopeptidase n=1 Tax=Luteitalea sp. TBR-22 TaxID=2802971 RepID=UPI001AF0C3D9|nr:M23 family metallopeptidase [Luteitalea sp. TBR-22]BCS34333.1 hypothetical protein TBR22_A35630 [Luteitalea sp. TBR-22]